MATVKMLRSVSGAVGGHYNVKVGDVIDVADVVADDLCDREDQHKLAERVTKKRAGRKKETASAQAPEAAVRPKAEPRAG